LKQRVRLRASRGDPFLDWRSARCLNLARAKLVSLNADANRLVIDKAGALRHISEQKGIPVVQVKSRLAICAAILGPEADLSCRQCVQKKTFRISTTDEKRGSFEGARRIPLRARTFLFNDLAFLRIPRKSLKFLTLLFSIPTALECTETEPLDRSPSRRTFADQS
jgi:hypothetical protein